MSSAIAIVGISGRFPSAPTPADLWRLMLRRGEAVRHFAPDELDPAIPASETRDPDYVAARPVLDDVDCFDAEYFGLSPAEARLMDPQHRVFLECCVHALEDAGWRRDTGTRDVGVFAGCSMSTYFLRHVLAGEDGIIDFTNNFQVGRYHELLGGLNDVMPSRAAYLLDLQGPVASIASGCSTSLLAIAEACQSLEAGQCRMALAGGVSISFPQNRGYIYQDGGMVSKTGTCRPYDAGATGTIFGSGAAVVALKPLEAAQRDGDRIYAVVRGWGITNDGADKLGFTAPSLRGHADAVRAALRMAEIGPDDLDLIEGHGTATPLGDPIEFAALQQALADRTRAERCYLTSVKANTGHLDAAAGVTGVIRTALSLYNETIPPQANFEAPNPELDLANSPFAIPTQAVNWPRNAHPRYAGVSSLGIGGTNVHLVVSEVPAELALVRQTCGFPVCLPLSARSERALSEAAIGLAEALGNQDDQPALADVAFTLQTRRTPSSCRLAIVGRDHAGAARDLRKAAAALNAPSSPARAVTEPSDGPPEFVFLLPGQGAQYPGMIGDLAETSAVVDATLEQGAAILSPLLGLDVRAALTRTDYPAEAITQTRNAQPLLALTQIAVARMLMGHGVAPSALVGHSVGEFAAAHLSGVMDFDEVLRLVARRGELVQGLPPGGMLAVRAPLEEITALLPDDLSLAAVNSPVHCTLSGPREAIEKLAATLSDREIACRPLKTSHAFHSAMMDPMLAALEAAVASIRTAPPVLPLISTLTGQRLTPEEATDPGYWARHCRQTVRFHEALCEAFAQPPPPGGRIAVDIGPGSAATQFLAAANPAARPIASVSVLPPPGTPATATRQALEALSSLWRFGARIEWSTLTYNEGRHVSLPPYPFARERHWVDRKPAARAATAPASQVVKGPAEGSPDLETADRQPAASTPASPRTPRTTMTTTRNDIVEMLDALTGTRIGEDQYETPFIALGFDSLVLGQFARKLEKRFAVKLSFRQMMREIDTVEALARHLEAEAPKDRIQAEPSQQPEASASAALSEGSATRPPPPHTPTAGAVAHAADPGRVPAAAAMAEDAVGPRAAPAGLDQVVAAQLASLERIFAAQLAAGGSQAPRTSLTAQPAQPYETAAPPSPAIPASPIGNTSPSTPAERQPPAVHTPPSARDRELIDLANSALSPRLKGRQSASPAAASSAERDRARSELVARLVDQSDARFQKSKAYAQRHRPTLADPRTASGFREAWKELVYPLVAEGAKGAYLTDLDGNHLLDLLNGFGQTLFGHSPGFVVEAVSGQLAKGFAIGPQNELAGEIADMFCAITGQQRMTFCNTGSEAVMAAMRIARAATGRDRVVMFGGDYHGQFEEVLVRSAAGGPAGIGAAPVASGIPGELVRHVTVLPYGHPGSLDWLKANMDDIAAVIVEPIQSRRPSLQPRAFLRELRRLTEVGGTLLVLDEVVTGFRVGPGGAGAVFGIEADLTTWGKVVGGGLPIGILAGRSEFMDILDGGQWQFGDDSVPEVAPTFFAGTFVRHPLALAAMKSVLHHVCANHDEIYVELPARTGRLVERLNAGLADRQVQLTFEHCASFFFLNVSAEPDASLLFPLLRLDGLHAAEGFACFMTTEHREAEMDRIESGFMDAFDTLLDAGLINGRAKTGTHGGGPAHSGKPGDEDIGVPLTEPQREILMLAQLGDKPSTVFNEGITIDLTGPLDERALEKALTGVVERHDALRSRIDTQAATLLPRDGTSTPIQIERRDLGGSVDAETELERIADKQARQPFDLDSGPLLRALLCRISPDRHRLFIVAHHIVCDGWSINVLVSELAALYSQFTGGPSAHLPTPLAFRDYARERAAAPPADKGTLEYWRQQMAGPPARPDLKPDRDRPTVNSFEGRTYIETLDAGFSETLRKLARDARVSHFALVFAGVQRTLARRSGTDDITFLVPIAGQTELDDAPVIGHLVDFLPVRVSNDETESLAAQARRVSDALMGAYEHRPYTLGTLVRDLDIPRQINRPPITDVQFNYETLGKGVRFAGLDHDVRAMPKRAVTLDLFFNVVDTDEGLRFEVDYATDLFDEATIAGFVEAFVTQFDPTRRLRHPQPTGQLATAPPAASSSHIQAGARPATVIEAFSEMVQAGPGRPAIRGGSRDLTYAELDALSERLAEHLGNLEGQFIGLLATRDTPTLIALFAIQKAGGIYVPLEPAYPTGRLEFIVTDSGMSQLLYSAEMGNHPLLARLNGLPASNLDELIARIDHEPAASGTTKPQARRTAALTPDSPLYLMYTSGSTGQPKGALIPHRGVVRLVRGQDYAHFGSDEVVLHHSPIAFDASTFEIYAPLLNGGVCALLPSAKPDLDEVCAAIEAHGITTAWFTAGLFHLLVDERLTKLKPLRQLLAGGDVLSPAHVARAASALPHTAIINGYGPTEATTFTTTYRVPAGYDGAEALPIGRALARTQLHILDENRQPVADAAAGELFIGGDGVALGYHRREDLDRERFVADPDATDPARRLYRTGDRVRMRSDGELEFLGRIDDQLKINGHRVELGEIENRMRAVQGVRDASVKPAQTPLGIALYAYAVPETANPTADQATGLIEAIRAQLTEQLPDSMLPRSIRLIDRLPHSPNGKVDRQALPDPDAATLVGPVVQLAPAPAAVAVPEIVSTPAPPQIDEAPAASDEPLETVLGIWRDVLKNPAIGSGDRFFSLGANSLHVFQITARLRDAGYQVLARQLMANPTPLEFARLLNGACASPETAREKEPETARAVASLQAPAVTASKSSAATTGKASVRLSEFTFGARRGNGG